MSDAARARQLLRACGQPDVDVEEVDGGICVKVRGRDLRINLRRAGRQWAMEGVKLTHVGDFHQAMSAVLLLIDEDSKRRINGR